MDRVSLRPSPNELREAGHPRSSVSGVRRHLHRHGIWSQHQEPSRIQAPDAMQTRYSNLIYSHETALFIHGLLDRTPFEYSASVPNGYKVVMNIAERFKIYYIKKEFHELGVVTASSSFGNPIKVYSIETTLLGFHLASG